jgi:type I restriction enzyme S subunit
MNEVMNVPESKTALCKAEPELRFAEFKSDWSNFKLSDISKFSKGKGISKADIDETGNTECIRYGQLYTEYGEVIDSVISRTNVPSENLVLSKKNDVIIPASGETSIDIATASCVQLDGIALGGDLNIIRTEQNGAFLAYYLNNKKKTDIAKFAQGNSVVHLYGTQLGLLSLNLPSINEQQKIADFLSSVDKKIEQLTEKHRLLTEYKKGVMQQIFTQQIRFKDNQGNDYPEWEEKSLKELLLTVVDNRGKTPPVSNDAQNIPLIEVNAIGGKKVNYSKVSKYVTPKIYLEWFRKHLEVGDILFSTVGQTAICSFFDDSTKAAIAQNIVGLRFSPELQKVFMFYLLTYKPNNNQFKKIEMIAVQPSVKVSQMIHVNFSIPVKVEQQKIANFLTEIDQKIDQAWSTLEQTKAFKKGLLQQMFV